MITGWGMNTRLRQVHYFREGDGFPLCATNTRTRSQATLKIINYDMHNPNTCPKCKELYEKIMNREDVRVTG